MRLRDSICWPSTRREKAAASILSRVVAKYKANLPRKRGLVGDIVSRFEKRGYKLAAMKLCTPSKEHLEKHYEDLSDKPFFKGLVTCMSGRQTIASEVSRHVDTWFLDMLKGPICAMVWEGRDAVKTGRGMSPSVSSHSNC